MLYQVHHKIVTSFDEIKLRSSHQSHIGTRKVCHQISRTDKNNRNGITAVPEFPLTFHQRTTDSRAPRYIVRQPRHNICHDIIGIVSDIVREVSLISPSIARVCVQHRSPLNFKRALRRRASRRLVSSTSRFPIRFHGNRRRDWSPPERTHSMENTREEITPRQSFHCDSMRNHLERCCHGHLRDGTRYVSMYTCTYVC